MRRNATWFLAEFAILVFIAAACGGSSGKDDAGPSITATSSLSDVPTDSQSPSGSPTTTSSPSGAPTDSQSPGGSPTAGGATLPTREQLLTERVEECSNAVFGGDTRKAYDCQHEDFRAKCSFSDFTGVILASRVLFESLLDISFDDMEVRVTGVLVEGDVGYPDVEWWVNDELIDTRTGEQRREDEGEYWIWDGGTWWIMNDNPDPCEGGITAEPTATPS